LASCVDIEGKVLHKRLYFLQNSQVMPQFILLIVI